MEVRSYNWIKSKKGEDNITLFFPETRQKFENELLKQRETDRKTIMDRNMVLFKLYTNVQREENEDCFIESIADTDAEITYPQISEKLREDKTDKGRRKRLFAVKILGRLARLNLEKKETVSQIIDELSRVSQEDEDPKIKIEATNQQARIGERIRSN